MNNNNVYQTYAGKINMAAVPFVCCRSASQPFYHTFFSPFIKISSQVSCGLPLKKQALQDNEILTRPVVSQLGSTSQRPPPFVPSEGGL